MNDQPRQDNHKTDSKSSLKTAAAKERISRVFSSPYWYRVPVIAVICLMAVAIWPVTDIGKVEAQKNEPAKTSQKQDKSAKDKSAEKSKTTKTPAQKSSPGKAEKKSTKKKEQKSSPSKTKSSGEKTTTTKDKQAEDKAQQEIMDLFARYAAASEKNPDSPEAKALSKQLDEAVKRMQSKVEKSPGANLNRLPGSGSPAKGKSSGTTVRPPRSIPKAFPKPPLPQHIPTTSKPTRNNSKPATKTAPKAKLPVDNKRVTPEPPTTVKPSGKEAATNQAELSLADGDVKITTQNDIIEINKLLEAIGKELKLNFIYPDGVIPSGKVKLQQYGTIKREELLPLLKSVLTFSGYSMVQEPPFIKIVKTSEITKKTRIFTPAPNKLKDPHDASVAIQILRLKYKSFNEVKSILKNFVPDESVITTIPDTNLLIITDYESQLPRLREIINMIDQPGPRRSLTIVTPEYITAEEAKSQIDSILTELNREMQSSRATPTMPTAPPSRSTSSRSSIRTTRSTISRIPMTRGTKVNKPTLMVDKRTNRLLIIGTEDQTGQVEHLLGLFDVPLPPKAVKLETLTVKYVEIADAINQLSSLLKALNAESSSRSSTPTRSTPTKPVIDPRTHRPIPVKTPTKSSAFPSVASQNIPFMLGDERTERIFVVGTEEQIKQVKDLLSLLDVVAPGSEIKLVAIDVIYLVPDEVMSTISELITALNDQATESTTPTQPRTKTDPRRKPPTAITRNKPQMTAKLAGPEGPYMVADDRTSRLLVVGSQDQIDKVKDLLGLLDVAVPGEEIKLVALKPEYLQADTAAETLGELIKALNDQQVEQSSPTRSPQTVTRVQPGNTNRPTPTRTAQTRQEQNKFITTGEEGPILVADSRTNRIFIIGNQKQIDQVKELMALLDVDIDLKLVPIQIKHVLASDIAQQLAGIIKALTEQDVGKNGTVNSSRVSNTMRNAANLAYSRYGNQGRRGYSRGGTTSASFMDTGVNGPMLLPDERTNRLLVVATQEQLDMINHILPILDVPPSEYDRMVLKIYQPKYVEAREVLDILDQLGITKKKESEMRPRDRAQQYERGLGTTVTPRPITPGAANIAGQTGVPYLIPGMEEPEIRTAIHELTNRIFVFATEYQLRDIDTIIKEVDIDPNDALGAVQVYQLENREPAKVADMLEKLLKTDREIKQSDNKTTFVPGREGAPIIVALEDIYAVAVRASAKQHKEIQNIIKILDKRLPQVLIEAILVQVNNNGGLNLGVSLKGKHDVQQGGDNKGTISGMSPFNLGSLSLSDSGFVTSDSGGGTLAFFSNNVIYATLEALESQGTGKVVSMPRILVNDNQEGTITSERQEPTTQATVTSASNIVTESFKGYESAGTTLKITPHISEGNFLKLDIDLQVNSFDGKSQGSIPPPKTINQVTTTITVPDNVNIILGGLKTQSNGVTVKKIPILGDIPLLGAAFRNVTRTETQGVLYVFVKANIVRSREGDNPFEDLDNLSEKDRLRLRRMEREYRGLPIIPGIKQKRDTKSVLDDDY